MAYILVLKTCNIILSFNSARFIVRNSKIESFMQACQISWFFNFSPDQNSPECRSWF